MQQVQEITRKEQATTSLKRRLEALKALEEWKRRHGEKLKGWDFISVIRHWREQH